MLGWEFPPLLTGGLGIACYGLAKALSRFAELTVIIPRSDPEFRVSQFRLIGLNELHLSDPRRDEKSGSPAVEGTGLEVKDFYFETASPAHFSSPLQEELLHAEDYRKFAQIREIYMDLNPYPSSSPAQTSSFIEPAKPAFAKSFFELPEQALHLPLSRYNPAPSQKSKPGAPFIDAAEAEALFGDTDVYGPNIMQKVAAYTEVVSSIASHLDFDLVHAHDWITFAAASRIKKVSGKPLVVHIHSLETDRVSPSARNDVYQIEKAGMENADRVFPVSNFTRGQISEHYGIDPAKLLTVYNGIEQTHSFHSEKPANEKWVVFLGRVTRQKGPFMILETARKLLKRMPEVRFYVAGIGDQLAHLQEAVKQEGLDACFVFTGFLSKREVHLLLSRADVYFMPSVSEPFGLSAVEAAQFDIPCVLSKQSGVVELLANALKADYWDTDRFSDLLYGVLNFQGIRDTVVTNTRNDLKKINWDDSAAHVSEIYSQLIVR